MKNSLLSTFLIAIFISFSITTISYAQSVLLYKNSFESPLIPPTSNCGIDLDATLVNTLWGGTGLGTGGGGQFQQINTVETILIHGPNLQYTDTSGLGGNYCLSMLSVVQDDKAALTLNSQMLPFANISFLMSSIDLAGCGGPFGMDTAVMRITVYDSPGGNFSFSSPGNLLDDDIITGGAPGITSFNFNWTVCATSLDISGSFDGNITIVFDLLRSGYAAIDSIEISSSISANSIGEHGNLNNMIAFPNPFSAELLIKGTSSKGEMTLFDVTGKKIIEPETFNGETKIKTDNLLPGFYLLHYLEEKKYRNIKLIKL